MCMFDLAFPPGDLQIMEDDAADTSMLMSLTEADAVSMAGELPKGDGETDVSVENYQCTVDLTLPSLKIICML